MKIVFLFSLLFICLVIGSNGGLSEQIKSQKEKLKALNPDDLKKREESSTISLLQTMENRKKILDQKAANAAANQEENNDSEWEDRETVALAPPPKKRGDMPDEQRTIDETRYANELQNFIKASHFANFPVEFEDPLVKAEAKKQTNLAVAGKFTGTR